MSLGWAWLLLAALWIGASCGGGALLALLATRLHEGLSYRKLWIFYTLLLAVFAAVVFAIAWF